MLHFFVLNIATSIPWLSLAWPSQIKVKPPKVEWNCSFLSLQYWSFPIYCILRPLIYLHFTRTAEPQIASKCLNSSQSSCRVSQPDRGTFEVQITDSSLLVDLCDIPIAPPAGIIDIGLSDRILVDKLSRAIVSDWRFEQMRVSLTHFFHKGIHLYKRAAIAYYLICWLRTLILKPETIYFKSICVRHVIDAFRVFQKLPSLWSSSLIDHFLCLLWAVALVSFLLEEMAEFNLA